MTYLPEMTELENSTTMTRSFMGMNTNPVIETGEFAETLNMTAEEAPLISVRKPRKLFRTIEGEARGICAHEKLCYVAGNSLIYDGVYVGVVEGEGPVQMVPMGNHVVIFPQKVMYTPGTGMEYLEQENSPQTDMPVSVVPCTLTGQDIDCEKLTAPPSNPSDGDYYIDVSDSNNPVLKMYSKTRGTWQSVGTSYVRISSIGIGEGFEADSTVTFSGFSGSLSKYNGDRLVYKAEDDSIIVVGTPDVVTVYISQGKVPGTIKRAVPDMDYVVELDNRLWGCSSENHEIYSCKLGDPKVWNWFTTSSAAAYAATVGSTGVFTGAFSHGGYVFFFKENTIHRVYGTKPSNYTLTAVNTKGVQNGSGASLAVHADSMVYMSDGEIDGYGSSSATSISSALANLPVHDGIAGSVGRRYYVSCYDDDGNHHLLVHDAGTGYWHDEESPRAVGFATMGRTLYMLDTDGKIWIMYGPGTGTEETDIEWHAETGDIGLDASTQKSISKVILRFWMEERCLFKVEASYDGSGAFTEMARFEAGRRRSVTVPMIPRRCDTMRLRFSGVGPAKIYSMMLVGREERI